MSQEAYDGYQDRNEHMVKEILKALPPEYNRYYMYLHTKKSKTKLEYINQVKLFRRYLLDEQNLFESDDFGMYKKLELEDVLSYLQRPQENGKPVSQRSYARNKFAMKSFFNFLYKRHFVDRRIFDEDDEHVHFETKGRRQELNRSEMNQLIYNVDHLEELEMTPLMKSEMIRFKKMWVCFIYLGLVTGARSSGFETTDIKDIDFVNNKIGYTSKGGKLTVVPFGEEMREYLTDWLKERKVILRELRVETDALFITKKGERAYNAFFNRRLEILKQGINKPVTCHVLRHTFCNNVYATTNDIYATQSMMGHSSVSATEIYARVGEQRKRKVAKDLSSLVFDPNRA